MKNVNFAINGLGRIGKLLFRALFDKGLSIKLVNEINGDLEINSELLIHDSIHGNWDKDIYLNKNDFQSLQESTAGEFAGIGIEVTLEDGFVKVITPIDDTPAQKAGVEAGDLIIKLDSTPVKGMSLAEAVKLMDLMIIK